MIFLGTKVSNELCGAEWCNNNSSSNRNNIIQTTIPILSRRIVLFFTALCSTIQYSNLCLHSM